jgi:hypothetical protein
MKLDWSDSPSWARYLAMDGNGAWFWYASKPTPCAYAYAWESENGLCAEAIVRHSNWRDTLEERPVEAEEGK